ncbi:Lrp/AsnC family transcriptional regulator [Novosphingobium sp.]|uniref:Lrp/AsnC family transcriptional regulator n=1 Tax=Novosphingobium sp. TaxID=1874826 RepID=UPI0038B6F961
MDDMDRRILAQLQSDSGRSHADLAEVVGLSASQVSRRIARLQADGVIRGQVALLDEQALALQVEAFVAVAMASYAPEVVRAFHERISSLEEVLDCCATTGDSDYLLRIVAHDLRAYSRLMNEQLLGHGDVASVRSSVVLDRIKQTTALPLPLPHA